MAIQPQRMNEQEHRAIISICILAAFADGAQDDVERDRMILNTAILNGALEIMPHTLATMAIIPVQMRMVYQIGKRRGYELDRGQRLPRHNGYRFDFASVRRFDAKT